MAAGSALAACAAAQQQQGSLLKAALGERPASDAAATSVSCR